MDTLETFADAIHGDIETVRNMLDENPQLATAAIDGCSMLHHAAGCNRSAAVKLLIERGENPDVNWIGYSHTPLSWAVTTGSSDACKVLLEMGARVDLFCAAGLGRMNDVKTFFDDAGQVRPGASITGSSRRRADGSAIAGPPTDPIDIISDAFYIACRCGRTQAALYLLDHGANPAFQAYMEASCFHWAYFGGGDPKLIQAILSHGGDPDSTWGHRHFTPRAFGIFTNVAWGWLYNINRILDIDPPLVNLHESGSTPLHEAAKSGNLEVVKTLITRGANPAMKDAEGNTAAKIAANAGVADWLKSQAS